ncbi:hypothetical protein EKN56_19970 [Limnobaculum zhutongyuii]|uniref:Uncharacterized protein n=1 Tax=Limnobaculum zhutongyuii TaxID=2498113 RepID=A0A411WQG2_9GAMM|nr:hypothetical protein [Limnobaculum zhutongyuii]QBH98469.1 hypothetical protein EKN56_19970 [Limnobaculum zhutongyuii]TQS89633.1 hypothetical protein ELQ32_04270 [Limnobaculum zhutongyuii]
MIIAIFASIVFIIIARAFIKSVRKNLNKLNTDKLMQQRNEHTPAELKLVACAQPLRCLEFFFNNQFTPENHMPGYYSEEQKRSLREILADDFAINGAKDLNHYRAVVLFKLLLIYLTPKQFVELFKISPPLLIAIKHNHSATEYQNLLADIDIHTINDALQAIAQVHPKKMAPLLADKHLADHLRHIEILYKAHVYTLACEVGYLDKVQMTPLTADIVAQKINWKQYDQSFAFLNRMMKTGLFTNYMIERKKEKVCWNECGVWTLQQQQMFQQGSHAGAASSHLQ